MTPTPTPTPSAREPSPPRVVVGVDGSAASVAALRWARPVAHVLHREIDAVTCWEPPGSPGAAGWDEGGHPESDAALAVARAVHEAFGHDQPAGLRTCTRQGHPARALLAAADGAELLVVGSRGHGGFVGLLLGSVSTACAAHARCPVAVVHETPTGQP